MTTGLIITKKQQRGRLTVKSDSLRREQRTLQRTCNAVKRQPTLNNFRERHARALAQAITDIIREYGYTQNIFLRLYLFYIDQFKTLEEIDIMKDIKRSINYFCAKRLCQEELPEKTSFKLFPRSVVVWMKRKTKINIQGGKAKKLKLIHSIAQCKNVLEGPNRSYYLEAYKKHAKTLSKPAVRTPIEILSKAYLKGQEFGKRVSKIYNPYKGYIPSGSATFDTKRSQGGKRSVLFKKNCQPNSSFRVEPTVLLLSGSPGVGKSRLVNEITRVLSQRDNFDFSTDVFVRNCNTSHWDGYRGQSVTILDDWSQDATEPKDLIELVSLVTDNSYPLPMADLKEKGTLFTSRYIILCTNLFDPSMVSFLNRLNGSMQVLNLQAAIRRLHHKYHIIDAKTKDVSYSTSYCFESRNVNYGLANTRGENIKNESRITFISKLVENLVQDQLLRSCRLLESVPEIRTDYPWIQTLYNVDQEIYVNNNYVHLKEKNQLFFPLIPNSETIPNVRTSAVSKPLGTRMVTMGSEELHVLKPFQVALWKTLGTYKKFQATHGIELSKILPILGKRESDQFILSGDYESATDGMNMDLSNAILNGILSQIDHEPTKRWAVYENGQHRIHYPSWTGIDPIIQTTGQLMGSLLSFPLLCLANDLITDLAGITEKKLINGDDLLAHANIHQINEWKRIGTICGMKPSVGKNYTSRLFGTFNSQLIMYGKHLPYTNLKLVYRSENIGDCAKIAQSLGISKKILVRRSHNALKISPQSIDVSYRKGGLGFETTKPDEKISRKDKLCYFTQLLREKKFRYKGLGLPKGYKWLVYPSVDKTSTDLTKLVGLSEDKLMLIDTINNSTDRKMKHSYMTFKDLNFIENKIKRNPTLRHMLNKTPFSIYPELDQVNLKLTIVKDTVVDKYFDYLFSKFLGDLLINVQT